MEGAIGTPAFLPTLQDYVHSAAPTLPLDPVVLQSILLCLIAKDRHLILRTPDEDVGLVVRLVASTISSVFGLSTHKLKLKDKGLRTKGSTTSPNNLDPAAFLRSLFIPNAQTGHHRRYSHSNQTSQDEGSGPNEPPQRKQASKRATPATTGGRAERSRSIPNNLAAISQEAFDDNFIFPGTTGTSDVPVSLSQSLISTTTGFISSASSSPVLGAPHGIVKPKAVYPSQIQPSNSAGSHRTVGTPPLPHAHTDPLPLPRRKRGNRDKSLKRPSSARPESIEPSLSHQHLPQALVVSGLEHAPESTHRALANVLLDKRVQIVPNAQAQLKGAVDTTFALPEGFFVVYVCPWDPRERPPIHKILLDKFAMSNNVILSPSLRNEMRAMGLSSHSASFLHHAGSHSNPATPIPSNPIPLPSTYTPPVHNKPLPSNHQHHHYHTQRDPSALQFQSESSTSPSGHYPYIHHNHHHHHHHHHTHSHPPSGHKSPVPPHIHTSVILGTPNSLNTPLPASPAFTYPPQRPILPPHLLPLLHSTMEKQTYLSYPLQTYLSDLLSAVRMNCKIDAVMVGLRARKDVEALVRAARVVGADLGGGELVRDVLVGGASLADDEYDDNHDAKDDSTSLLVDEKHHVDKDSTTKQHRHGASYSNHYSLRSDSDAEDEDRKHLLSPSINSAPSSPHRPRIIRPSKSNSSVQQRQRLADAHPTSASPLALIADDVNIGMTDLLSPLSHNQSQQAPTVATGGTSSAGSGPKLDISEVDVARIIPRVLSHRVRMRDGYDDEIFSSLLVGAVSAVEADVEGRDGNPMKPWGGEDGIGEGDAEEPQTVKDVFVHILAEV